VVEVGARLELELTDLAHGGDAVGRHDGQAVFVPLGVPGERVRVDVVECRRRYLRARLLDVLTPSPHRVEPRCPHYEQCGGCHLQHIAYQRQLELKRHTVRTALERIGRQGAPSVLPMMGMDGPWAYRNHVQLSVDGAGRLGYLSRSGDEVVAISECPIMERALDQVWRGLSGDLRGVDRVVMRAGTATGERVVILEGPVDAPPVELPEGTSVLWRSGRGEPRVVRGSPYVHERVAGRTWRVSASSFFQVNTRQAARLVAVAGEYLGVRPGETVVDAYCGVGLFALALTEGAARVVGIEESTVAIADARANAVGRAGVEFWQGRAERLARWLPHRVDAVIVDPPRAGCDEAVLGALAAREPSRIVYVSCDPATLARDVARLDRLGYRLDVVRPVDMFPQTYHIECVALLQHAAP